MGDRAYACNLSTKQMPGATQTLTREKQSLCVCGMQLAGNVNRLQVPCKDILGAELLS